MIRFGRIRRDPTISGNKTLPKSAVHHDARFHVSYSCCFILWFSSTFVSPTYVASQLQLIWYMTEFDPVIVREFSTSIPKR
ncbi:unnamed protein product [Rotaria magnacalcarata]|uniref:Uncharacterized protein n=1 Tax=Rotaria magnacalcarata TaxID=392030 RepID=A0A816QJD2_9BILA|nr:unnamed protein product [Rotaria magnacalcarata]